MESLKGIIKRSGTETKFTTKDYKFMGKTLYFMNMLWKFKPAKEIFLYRTPRGDSAENFSFVNFHDIIDHIGSGLMADGYDLTESQYEIDFEFCTERATAFFLYDEFRVCEDGEPSFYNRNQENYLLYLKLSVKTSLKHHLTLPWITLDIKKDNKARFRHFLPYYDTMTDQEVFELFKLVSESTENAEEKVTEYLKQFEPRIRRMWIFNYLLRLSNYDYVEAWLDSLLAGTSTMPEIPDFVLKRNAELNEALKNGDPNNILSYDRSDEYKAQMIAKIAILEAKVAEFINKIAPSDIDKASFLKYFKENEPDK